MAAIEVLRPRQVYRRVPSTEFGEPGVRTHGSDPRRTGSQAVGPVFLARFADALLTPVGEGGPRTTAILDAARSRVFSLDRSATEPDAVLGSGRVLNGAPLACRRFAAPRARFADALLVDDLPINYGHWITDGFPVLGFAMGGDRPDRRDGTTVLIAGHRPEALRARFLEFLAAYGIGGDRVVFLDDHLGYRRYSKSGWRRRLRRVPWLVRQDTVRVDDLLVVTGHVKHPVAKYPGLASFYRGFAGRFPVDPGSPGRRLFVSREDAKDRRLVNEEEIFALCRRQGFEKVLGSRLSCREAVEAFSRAEIVVGVCGASMANIVFAPPRCRVVNLVSEEMGALWYWDLANVLSLPYCEVRGRVEGGEPGKAGGRRSCRDFSIPPAVFAGALSERLPS